MTAVTILDVWRDQAACLGKPTAWWYPVGHGGRPHADGTPAAAGDPDERANLAAALVLCAACPVLAECRAGGIEHEADGVWGGTTPNERSLHRRTGHIRLNDPAVDIDPQRRQRSLAVQLHRRGWRIDEIAAELGQTTRQIHRWLDREGIQTAPPPRPGGRKQREPMTARRWA